MWRDFLRFLNLVFGSWVGAMSGGIGLIATSVGFLLALYLPSVLKWHGVEKVDDWMVLAPIFLFVLLGYIGLFVAFFRVWRTEFTERTKLQAKLDEMNNKLLDARPGLGELQRLLSQWPVLHRSVVDEWGPPDKELRSRVASWLEQTKKLIWDYFPDAAPALGAETLVRQRPGSDAATEENVWLSKFVEERGATLQKLLDASKIK